MTFRPLNDRSKVRSSANQQMARHRASDEKNSRIVCKERTQARFTFPIIEAPRGSTVLIRATHARPGGRA